MESLTSDLQQLVRSGQINFHQAREMMFAPTTASEGRGGTEYAPSSASSSLSLSSLPLPASDYSAPNSNNGSASGRTPLQTKIQMKASRSKKKRARLPNLLEDEYMVHAIIELSKILTTVTLNASSGGLFAAVPSDVLCPILASLEVVELMCLGATSKLFWSIARSDALWKRLYLARWKQPKPPGPLADCPRYHLNFYELYRRRVLINLMKGPRDVIDVAESLRPNVEAGKVAPSLPAVVQVDFRDDSSILAVNIEGDAFVFEIHDPTPQLQVSGRVIKEHQEKKAYLDAKLKELAQPWKNSLVQFKLNKAAKNRKNPGLHNPAAPTPSGLSVALRPFKDGSLDMRGGSAAGSALSSRLRSKSSPETPTRKKRSHLDQSSRRMPSPGGLDLWGNVPTDDEPSSKLSDEDKDAPEIFSLAVDGQKDLSRSAHANDHGKELTPTHMQTGNSAEQPSTIPISIPISKKSISSAVERRRLHHQQQQRMLASEMSFANEVGGAFTQNSKEFAKTEVHDLMSPSPSSSIASSLESISPGNSWAGGGSSPGSAGGMLMMMVARSKMKTNELKDTTNAPIFQTPSGDPSKESERQRTPSKTAAKKGQKGRPSKKEKREQKRLEKLRRAQARKDAAEATALKKRQARDMQRVKNSDKRAALGLSVTPESSPILRAASAPSNSSSNMKELLSLHARNNLSRPQSPPPSGTIMFGHSPPGNVDIGGEPFVEKSILRGKNSSKKKKKKRKGRKQNSWQQAREDRLRNMALERQKRDRNKMLAQPSPGSGSDSGNSGAMSGTTSGSESDGSESGWGFNEGCDTHGMKKMPVISVSSIHQYRDLTRSHTSTKKKKLISRGVSSMVFAEVGSDTVVAFNIDNMVEKNGKHSSPMKLHSRRKSLISDAAAPNIDPPSMQTDKAQSSSEGKSTGKKNLKLFAQVDERLTQLQPVSLHRPRWIRGDQWQVQSAMTALDGYVVLGHSGETGTAAITVWDRNSGKQLHTMYGSRGAVRFLLPIEMHVSKAMLDPTSACAPAEPVNKDAQAQGQKSTVVTMLSGDAGGGVCLWDIRGGTLLYALPNSGSKPVTSLSINRSLHCSSSSMCVVIMGDDVGTLRVWESVEQKPFGLRGVYVNAHVGIVTTTALARWQEPIQLVASGGEDCTIRIWETEEISRLEAHRADETIADEPSMMDSVGGVLPQSSSSLAGWTKVLRGHEAPITGLAIDLIKVTSCSLDGTIKIWGTVGKHAGNCMRTLMHPFVGVRKVPVCSLRVENLRIAAGFEDGSVLLYNFGHKKKKARANNSLVGKSVKSFHGRTSAAWRKGGTSPQAKRHAKNTSKGANRKYVSGGNRRSLRDLQAKCKDPSMLLFDFEDDLHSDL